MFGSAFLESGDWQYIVLVFLVSIAFVFVCHLIPWDDDYKDDDDESDFRQPVAWQLVVNSATVARIAKITPF